MSRDPCCQKIKIDLESRLRDEMTDAMFYSELAMLEEVTNRPYMNRVFERLSNDELEHFRLLTYIAHYCGFKIEFNIYEVVGITDYHKLGTILAQRISEELNDKTKYIYMAKQCPKFEDTLLHIAEEEEIHLDKLRESKRKFKL